MTGRVLHTVLGSIKMIPECKAQAVCVNGSRCWEAGHCLKAPPEPPVGADGEHTPRGPSET